MSVCNCRCLCVSYLRHFVNLTRSTLCKPCSKLGVDDLVTGHAHPNPLPSFSFFKELVFLLLKELAFSKHVMFKR